MLREKELDYKTFLYSVYIYEYYKIIIFWKAESLIEKATHYNLTVSIYLEEFWWINYVTQFNLV